MKRRARESEPFKGVSLAICISDDSRRTEVQTMLSNAGCKIQSADSIDFLIDIIQDSLQAVILDMKNSADFLEALNNKHLNINTLPYERIILAEEGKTEEAYQIAQKIQGFFVADPLSSQELLIVLERTLDILILKKRLARYESTEFSIERFGEIVVKSPEMKDVVRLAKILASREDSILIVGGVGCGKELLARTIHENSVRRYGPFYSINCRSFSSEELASELFGRGDPGSPESGPERTLLDMCDGGTLLLDEIGSISPNVQGKLQRFLEDGTYTRVNSRTVCKADVRIFSSTSTPLDESVAKGEFSEELYFRLNRFTLNIPPLRRRMEDIPVLVKTILQHMAKEKNEEPLKFTEEALKLLMEYCWPGNVRELENVLEFASLVAGNGPIEPKHMPKQFHDEVGSIFVGSSVDELPPMSEIERRYILRVMDATRGNKVKAATILDINRATLHRKLQMYEKEKLADLR
ncbi:MAG: sigma 54-interacting transcriptional regulator [bacterium]|jgi:DNA-binding NtrC family response regulator